MPNDYFQFKKFTVHQGKTAMKVSTDACIQGALAANIWQKETLHSILDIGAGTGLLSLMLAQKLLKSTITAIEIEAIAFEQAKENFEQSPWQNNLKIECFALQDFQTEHKFDAIICNPPFFHKHLNSESANRNQARHDNHLSKEDLAKNAHHLLEDNGTICVLYPLSEWASWLSIAKENGLYLHHEIAVQPYPNKPINRVIGFFKKQNTAALQSCTLTIYTDAGKKYTSNFVALLQDYYLHL